MNKIFSLFVAASLHSHVPFGTWRRGIFCFLFLIPSIIHAAGPGINIGTKYSDIDPAISVVGSGGWIVVIAGGTGDCANLNKIIAKTDAADVNLIIRGHLNNQLSPQDALAWAATLGQLKHTKKIYFMPWNEPNQAYSGDYADPAVLVAYTDALQKAMDESCIRRNKIVLLSPMLNQTWSDPNNPAGDFDLYVGKVRAIKGNYFSEFDGIAMNLYDQSLSTGCGSVLCSDNPHRNPLRYKQLLADMGASGKEAYGVESGTAGNEFYWKSPPSSASPLYGFVKQFGSGSDAKMFAIPSYDLAGEVGHNWSLFNPPDTANEISNLAGSGTQVASPNQTCFDSWLDPLVASGELISCGNCGFAHSSNPGLCNGTGGLGNFTLPAECNLNQSGDQTSRPVACQICNQTNKMVSSCATSFTVFDKVSYQQKDGDLCDGKHWVEKSWGGTVSLDLSSTEIPFVGKKGEENEQYYLADYYEGTYPYYTTNYIPYNLMSGEEQRQAFMQGGVWSKLATRDMQDAMKKRLIARAVASKNGTITEDVVRDYEVILYNQDGTINLKKRLTDFVGNYPPGDEIQRQGWIENNDFGKLWFKVPMFSREDTKGLVIPYLGSMQKDTFTIENAEEKTIERVPHLARLYEVSRAINQMLLPAAQQTLGADIGNKKNLATSTTRFTNNQMPGNKSTLLASNEILIAQNPRAAFHIEANSEYSGGGVLVWVTFVSEGCDGDITLSSSRGSNAGPNGWNGAGNYTYEPQWTGSPIPISPGQTVGVSYTGSILRGPTVNGVECTHQTASISCTFSLSRTGEFSTTCGPPAPPGPVCGSFTAQPVGKCEKEAEIGPGDTICCGTIDATLNATDRIENKQHTGCNPVAFPLGVGDPCNTNVDADVRRSLGVSLSHPYLKKIWEDTVDNTTGFINLWKLAGTPAFEPKEAKSTINYSYSSHNKDPNIDPSTGDFYYPYLGGIFEAKNWLVNALLTKGQQEQLGE